MKILIVIIVIAILAVGGYYIYKGNYKSSSQSSSDSVSTSTVNDSASTDSVNISNFSFNPDSITVKAGSPITFTNNDNVTHTVTANDGKFNEEISAGKTVTITISDPGTYDYHCSIHTTMKGTIVVQ